MRMFRVIVYWDPDGNAEEKSKLAIGVRKGRFAQYGAGFAIRCSAWTSLRKLQEAFNLTGSVRPRWTG